MSLAEITFITSSNSLTAFIDVYYEGRLLGSVQPTPSGKWFALLENADLPVMAEDGKWPMRFDSKLAGAARLIEIDKLRNSFDAINTC